MFYEFDQNNTFGKWVLNDDVLCTVIIEADDSEDASIRAEDIGLYFDGVSLGKDCPCCGDRWYGLWSDDGGDEVPSTYGKPIENLHPERVKGEDTIVVHFKDGTRQYASEERDKQWLRYEEED